MNFPYDIIKFVMCQSDAPGGIPDATILKPMVIGFPALIAAIAIGASIRLEWIKRIWFKWKPLFYPTIASFFFVGAVIFRVYNRFGWFIIPLWFAPAVAVMILSAVSRYGLRAPRGYIWACVLGGPITTFMISNYMAARITGEFVFIGYIASLVLSILSFDFLLCGIIGLIWHHFRRTS